MAVANSPLRVIAQPKKSYRERYQGELAASAAQRFLQAADNRFRFKYPTLEITPEWTPKNGLQSYIHVTLTTVPHPKAPCRCIHPYPLTSEDPNVQKDLTSNSLYYPISMEEFQQGHKSLPLTLNKLTQRQLENMPMRLFDTEQLDAQRLSNPTDTKELIKTYQLNQSQLVFTICELSENEKLWTKFRVSTVYADVMTGTMPAPASTTVGCRWAPQRGSWEGHTEILIVFPQIDGRRVYTIYMEHEQFGQTAPIPHQSIGKGTISLFTPPCPVNYPHENSSLEVAIVIQQGDTETARMNFTYIAPHRCAHCNTIVELPDVNTVADHDSTFLDFEELDEDDAPDSATLGSQHNCMLDLSSISNETKAIRSSLRDKSQNDTQPAPMNLTSTGAKRTCHHLEQENENGDTPLLTAARHNQCLQMEIILQQEPHLSQQADREGNNLLHLLVKLSEDKAMSTVQSVFRLLPVQIKKSLILMSNKNGQTPLQLALSYGHPHYHELFVREMNVSDANTLGAIRW